MRIEVPYELVSRALHVQPSAKGLLKVLMYASGDSAKAAHLIGVMDGFSGMDVRDFSRLLESFEVEAALKELETCRKVRRLRANLGARLRAWNAVTRKVPNGMTLAVAPSAEKRQMIISLFPGGNRVTFETRKKYGLRAAAELSVKGATENLFVGAWRAVVGGREVSLDQKTLAVLREAVEQNVTPEIATVLSG